jgi:membrane-associated phospholipid phosphatase
MVSTFLFVYSLHEAIRIRNERGVFPWTVTLVTGLFFILMPIARVHIKCHTIPQVIAGIVLGTFWTCLFILFEQYVLLKWDRYVKDKKRFEDSFFET